MSPDRRRRGMIGAAAGAPHVSILLCTFNGAEFLPAQIRSYLGQSHARWSLHVSDDGSSDDTREVLDRLCRTLSNPVEVVSGPGQGAARNFLSLICSHADAGGYLALSDQDDIWLPEKLDRAIEALERGPADQPAVYGSRTTIVDRQLNRIRLSPLFRRPPSFRNALVQNIAGGNTLVLNAAAAALIRRAGCDLDLVSHDWWIYQLVTGHGGRFHYDPRPGLLYRQHRRNLVGHNRSVRGALNRLYSLQRGRYWAWIGSNLGALDGVGDLLTEENRRLVAEFRALRGRPAARQPLAFHRLGLHRQNPLETGLLHAGLLASQRASDRSG